MHRRTFLSAALGAPAILRSQPNDRPNVLFIASDDMNNSLGCYGHPIVKTPNLDKLAARGVRFDRAYCQYPLCGPSRCSLLTGLRPDSTHIKDNNIAVRDKLPDVVTLPQLFKNSGWRSVRAGKMYHMDVPGSVGTNKWDDPPSWDVAISPPGSEQLTKGEGGNIIPGRKAGWQVISFAGDGKDQADEKATEIAFDTISANPNRPWFLGLGYLRPHVPHVAPSRFFDLYPLGSIPAPTNPANDLDDIPEASEIAINTRAKDMGGMSDNEKKQAIRAYYASVSYMDWQVGRVLDTLEKSGQARRTIVVFWGDHGWHLGEKQHWRKFTLWEEATRAPLIWVVPGVTQPGTACGRTVDFQSIYPTLTDLAGIPTPKHVEGKSLRPLLKDPKSEWSEPAITTFGYQNHAVRTEGWRYIRYANGDEELYDEKADPKEWTNLAQRPEHAQKKAELKALLPKRDADEVK